MLYHEKGHKNEEKAKFVHIVYRLAKLCSIFDDFYLTSVYLLILQLVLGRAAALKCLPSSIVQIIFSFCPFKISEGILRNQKFIIGFDSFSNHRFCIFGPVWIMLVFVSIILLKVTK